MAIELPPLQTAPAAWRAADIARRTDWIVELEPAEIAELEAAALPFARADALARVTRDTFPLPRLAARWAALRSELLHGRGFVLVRGVPVERVPLAHAAAMFLGVGAHLGRARSQNAKGHLLGHVYDLGRSAADPTARIYQTNQRQTFHTDSCDVVGLLCLREAVDGGDSLLVSALAIYNAMYEHDRDLLARLLEPMAHDRRGEVPAGMLPYFEIPVFSWFAGLLTVFYQRQYFDSAQRFANARRLTPEDVAALDRFDALANDAALHVRMRLAPGDMQFVHNHVLLHDRTAFIDRTEAARKRHLLRLWLACEGARPLPPAFAARYGSLTVGDRGGIVVPDMQPCVPLEPA